jgi:hypothetical protein
METSELFYPIDLIVQTWKVWETSYNDNLNTK